jgi:hypothetical protein
MTKRRIDLERAEEEAGIVLSAAAEIRSTFRRSSRHARMNGDLALKVDGILERAKMAYGDAFEENGVEDAILSQAAVAA